MYVISMKRYAELSMAVVKENCKDCVYSGMCNDSIYCDNMPELSSYSATRIVQAVPHISIICPCCNIERLKEIMTEKEFDAFMNNQLRVDWGKKNNEI